MIRLNNWFNGWYSTNAIAMWRRFSTSRVVRGSFDLPDKPMIALADESILFNNRSRVSRSGILSVPSGEFCVNVNLLQVNKLSTMRRRFIAIWR